jgi:transposase InsO family protein
VAVDDHSRYAYIEQLPDERAGACAAFLGRALAHFDQLGMSPEAVMTDGAVAYRRSRAFAAVLGAHGLRRILTPPYTPRWNGKAERLIQTLKREGLRPRVAVLGPARPCPLILGSHLQSAAAPQPAR